MSAVSGPGQDSGGTGGIRSRERVVGRLGPARGRQTLSGLGVLIAAILIAALVTWTSPGNIPPPSPTPAPSVSAIFSDTPPTPSSANSSEAATPSPDPTVPLVEPTIVDRPGVPTGLYDKYWVALGQVGQVGTTARMVMPPGEAVLAAGADRVASFRLDSNYEPVVGPDGVRITIRDLRTGATLRTFDSPVHILGGLIAGSLLFWQGLALPSDAEPVIDGGVWVIDLADPGSEPRAIIPESDLSAPYGPHASRGLLKLTDRGRLLITRVGGETGRGTDVIDVASLTRSPTLDRILAIEIIDGLAIVAPVHGDGGTPDRPNRLRLIDIATGKEVGPGIETDLVKASVLGEGEVFVQYSPKASDSIIAAIDLETGEARELRLALAGTETLNLSRELSVSDLLVLVPTSGAELDSEGRVRLPVTLLDPSTGDIQPDAFIIGSP